MCIRDRNNITYITVMQLLLCVTRQEKYTIPVSYTHLDVYKRQGYIIKVKSCRAIVDKVDDISRALTNIYILLYKSALQV